MFETPEADAARQDHRAHRTSSRPTRGRDKLDLGVGVYKDAAGRTPVMRAVKAAEARLLAEQDTKAYVGLLGDLAFVAAMARARARRRRAGRAAGRRADPGRHRGDPPALRADPPREPGRHRLALRPDLAEPPGDPRLPRHAGAHLPLLRRRDPRRRLRRHDGRPRRGSRPATSCCCTAAATTRPAPTSTSTSGARSPTAVIAAGAVPLIDLAYQGFGDGLDADVGRPAPHGRRRCRS